MSNLVPGDKAQHSDQVCVCGVTIGGYMMCDYAAQKTLINAMTYNGIINDYPDTQTSYVTLPNDTFKLNSFMCSGLN